MDIELIDYTYVTNISKLLTYNLTSTILGCFQNTFYPDQQVECFKSFILTQQLCINFCSLNGTSNSLLYTVLSYIISF